MSPHIEILLATYNGEKYLGDLIQSIAEQEYQNYSILFSDDGSKDKSVVKLVELLEQLEINYKNVSPQNKFGNSKSNFEHLLKQSSAQYVMLADQDDIWKKTKIKHSLALLQKLELTEKNSPCLVFTDLEVVNESLQTLMFCL